MAQSGSYRVVVTRGPVLRVEVMGDVDVGEADALDAGLRELASTGRPLEVAMEGVTFMGSAGLRALVAARADAEGAGGSLTVVSASQVVRRLLDITALAEPLGLGPASDQAPAPTRS